MTTKIDLRDGNQIRNLRRKLRVSQVQFWLPFGVTQSGGSRYESGREIPEPIVKLLTIAFGTETESANILKEIRHLNRKAAS